MAEKKMEKRKKKKRKKKRRENIYRLNKKKNQFLKFEALNQ